MSRLDRRKCGCRFGFRETDEQDMVEMHEKVTCFLEGAKRRLQPRRRVVVLALLAVVGVVNATTHAQQPTQNANPPAADSDANSVGRADQVDAPNPSQPSSNSNDSPSGKPSPAQPENAPTLELAHPDTSTGNQDPVTATPTLQPPAPQPQSTQPALVSPAPPQSGTMEHTDATPNEVTASVFDRWMWPVVATLAGTLAILAVTWFAMTYRAKLRHEPEATAVGGPSAFTDFLDLFFGPMVEDGQLASHEFAPLAAAYFALGVEPSSDFAAKAGPQTKAFLDQLRQGMQQRVKEIFGQPGQLATDRPSPGTTRKQLAERLLAAWRRMTHPPAIHRLTLADRDSLLRWIENTLSVWGQEEVLQDLRKNAASHDENYLRANIGTRPPNDGDRKRVRGYFTAAERLLAQLHAPDETEPMLELGASSSTSSAIPVDPAISPAGDSDSSTSSAGSSVALGVPVPQPPLEARAKEASTTGDPGKSASESPHNSQGGSPPPVVPPSSEPTRLPQLVRVDLTAKYSSVKGNAVAYAGERCRALRDQAKDILQNVEMLFGDFTKPAESPLAFSKYRSLGAGHVAVVAKDVEGQTGNVWFLGDIHGDLLALDSAIDYIDGLCPEATIVFLGDLFDDEGFGYEVVLRVFQLMAERPGRIGYIVGNHDVSLHCNDDIPVTFSSSVSPSDFADFLNSQRDDPVVSGVGNFAVRFFRFAPRAIFLPDGLVVVHGGVPLNIRFPAVVAPADLEKAECLQDFVWTRAHERARKKIPNPTSKTSEFGFEDFTAFCEHISTKLAIPTNRMVRGHDHFEAGHSTYERWTRNSCVTVNTMSRRLPRDPFGPFERTPCVARWFASEPLEIHQLVIPAFMVQGFYGSQQPTGDSVGHS